MVRCSDTGLPEGTFVSVALRLPPDLLGRFPLDPLARVTGGALTFPVPADQDGAAEWEVEGVAKGDVRWSAAATGAHATCTAFRERVTMTLVHGTVRDEDGAPVGDARIEGCGGVGRAELDGSFAIFVEAGSPCELRAIRYGAAEGAAGDPATIAPRAGVDASGVELVAPDPPAWRDLTPEEEEIQRAEYCAFWGGRQAERSARIRSVLPRGIITSAVLQTFEEARREWAVSTCDPTVSETLQEE